MFENKWTIKVRTRKQVIRIVNTCAQVRRVRSDEVENMLVILTHAHCKWSKVDGKTECQMLRQFKLNSNGKCHRSFCILIAPSFHSNCVHNPFYMCMVRHMRLVAAHIHIATDVIVVLVLVRKVNRSHGVVAFTIQSLIKNCDSTSFHCLQTTISHTRMNIQIKKI